MWKKLNGDVKNIIRVLLVMSFVGGVIALGLWSDNNGVRVETSEVDCPFGINENGQHYDRTWNIENPIQINAYVKYRGDGIVSQSRIVEFCEVKEAKKEMKQIMKVIWKDMKAGCN